MKSVLLLSVSWVTLTMVDISSDAIRHADVTSRKLVVCTSNGAYGRNQR